MLAFGRVLVGVLLLCSTFAAQAAEREDVRKVINLVTSVKMPFPESLSRSRARTERVWLERDGLTIGCIRMRPEERRWCYEHIGPVGNRAEMLRIRNEPLGPVRIGQLYHYVVDFDLDGMIDVGSTTRIEADNQNPPKPIGNVIQFFFRGVNRGETYRAEYQKMYDEGIQYALRYFGE